VTQLAKVRRALKRLKRPEGGRLRSMSWLADEIGVSRVVLYAALRGDCRNRTVDAGLMELLGIRLWGPDGAEELGG
jgi:hypothetical protein